MGLDYIEDREESLKAHIEEIRKKVENSYPSKNGLKIPEIVMLYYAQTYKTEQTNFQSFWYYDYGVENPEEMLLSLEQRGFICPASARESVNNLKVNELKELLKELDLKVSGKKEELITRIDENASDEWLEEKIKNRAYNLTDLAAQELKENKYVLDFHKVKIKYGVDVWWINQQLYIRNYPKSLYRDLIYGELNRKLNETMKDMQEDNDGTYVPHVYYGRYTKEIAEFFMEENKFNDAFRSLAESVYYTISSNLIPYIHMGTKYISERILSIELFQRIKSELGLSNDDMFKKIVDFYNGLNFPAPFSLLPNHDAAGLILALMNGEDEVVKKFFKELEKNSNARVSAQVEKMMCSRSNKSLNDNNVVNTINNLSNSISIQNSTMSEQTQRNINISESKSNNDTTPCTQEQKDPLHGWGGCLGCLGCMLAISLIICLIIVAIKLFS